MTRRLKNLSVIIVRDAIPKGDITGVRLAFANSSILETVCELEGPGNRIYSPASRQFLGSILHTCGS